MSDLTVEQKRAAVQALVQEILDDAKLNFHQIRDRYPEFEFSFDSEVSFPSLGLIGSCELDTEDPAEPSSRDYLFSYRDYAIEKMYEKISANTVP